ncbi:TIGR04388 family protein [Leptospira yasudae]|uniref:TIGR04388 family protein n=1 Tax=Leptospira yasudae TaxID=2202201 RepID=A0A6N4QBD7_9LEPT|nr:TIGR04388 family protein [Leptospira yasudae]TGL79369.1 TIGR04388 family protein [Leptospira yasudae]TGL85286.1 TIGR04388 family protein [Leptospira yasudae]
MAAENAQKNQERAESHLVEKVLTLNSGMKDAPITKSDIEKYMPKDKDGNLTHDAQPEKLLAKWDEHKAKMAQTEKGLAAWEKDVSQAGEKAGIEVRFNEGKSATSTFGKFVKGLAGDFAMSMGFANDGNKMVDKQGVFHSDTCFVAGTQVHTSNGLKSIETIVVGDIVQSWNEKTGAFEKKRVTELFVHEVPQLFYLELDGEEELHTTWNHPFRRKVISSGDKVPPFDPRGIERKFKTHEHLLQPIGRIVSLIGSPNEPQSAVEEIPLSTKSNSGFSDVTLSKTVYSEWTKVEDLKLRDQVLKSDGSWGTVTGIYYYNVEPTQVYNLEVEDNHTYVVGEAGYVVHNYTEQVQRVLDGDGILSEDNTKMLKSANAKDKIRALNDIKEFDYAGSKWKNVGTDEKGVAHFQSESNKYGLKEDLYFRNNKGQVEIEQVQHLNGKEYSTKHPNLDVLKQTVIGVNFKTTGEYLNHLNNVLGERGGSGTKYDVPGTPKVSLVKDANGQPKLHETSNGNHMVEIERKGYKGKMVVEEVGRTQREARSDYSGERGLVKKYDLSNPLEKRAYDAENDTPTKIVQGGDHLRDVAVCQSTVIAEDRHNNGKTVGEVAKVMGDFAAKLGKRPSQLSIKEISQALNESGLTVKDRLIKGENETRAQFNDKFFEFAKRQLDQGFAINVGGTYASSLGHVTRITGYVEGPHGERGFMINDSYGDANKGYARSGANGSLDGRAVFYPIDKIKIAEFNYAYTIAENTGANTPSGGGSSTPRRRSSSSGGFWNKFSNIFKFDFFKRD